MTEHPTELSQEFDESLINGYIARILPSVFLVSGLLYVLISFSHLLLLQGQTRFVLLTLACVSVCFYGFGWWKLRRKLSIESVPLWTFFSWLPIWLNSFMHILLSADIHQTTNLCVSIIAGGLFILWRRLYITTNIIVFGSWFALIWHFRSEPLVVHYSFSILFFAALALTTHAALRLMLLENWRSRQSTLRRSEELEDALTLVRVEQAEKDEAHRKLASHSARMHEILAHVPILVCVLDLNGRVIMVEGQNAELFHELSEDQQEEWSVTRLLSPLAPLVFKARKEKEAEGIVHLFDRIWSTHLQLVASGGAEPEHLIAVLYDTTENHKSQQARDQFVSMVSHELRTPLTAIHGAIQLLSQEGILGAQQRKNLFHLMQRNTGRLRSIINDLLDLNKIKAGQLHFVLEPKQLQSLLQLTIETLDSLSEHHDTRIQLEAPSEPITVVVDEQRLQQVTTNFLSNAIKFSPKGSVIEVNVQVERNHVKVSVLDEGPGVPEDKRDMIFQPFVQVDNSSQRTKGGTGLGLALAQQFIVRMDGTIGYEAQEKGACFWFKLPLA